LKNLATVLKVVEVFNTLESVTNMQLLINDVLVGLEHVTKLTGLQGRWQLLKSSPNIIADTGHNLAGIEYVVHQLKNENYQHLHIIIGFANDKDISYILKILPQTARYYFTQAQINRALAANELQKIALESGLVGNQYNTIAEALKVATENASTNDLIFIGGSNFVVGEAIELINSNL
jgi:dihydrofolate synthase / folylpolyglutamate synthase